MDRAELAPESGSVLQHGHGEPCRLGAEAMAGSAGPVWTGRYAG